ncbi:MAG: hypothetical protein ACNS62_11430 [Candidatus Cyclobacteriaceae bacterium M3_2C_046]
MQKIVFLLLASGVLFYACAPKASKSSTGVNIQEDLAQYRSDYEYQSDLPQPSEELYGPETNVTPTNDMTARINTLLDSIAVRNKKLNYVQGFTIIIPAQNPSDAGQIRQGIYELIPDANPKPFFDPPNYKVKVGKFYTRLEAQKSYSMIKESFPKAILVPERIALNY